MQQKEDKPEVLYIEAVGMQGSGWIQDDTIGTANPIEIAWPGRFYIPKTGHRKAWKTEVGADGKEKKVWFNEPIRHIRNSPMISEAEQKLHGITPSPDPSEDIIFLEKGCGFFVREGGSIGTFDFLNEAYYNESNVERAASATALYRVIKIEEKNENDLESEMMAADAIKFVGTLYEKKNKGKYVYNEQAIDSICQLLSIFAETYSGKVIAIQTIAKQRPEWFLDKVMKFQQTTLTEVSHALELNVIAFEKNSVQYKEKDKVIVSLGSGTLTHDKKMEAFANWLRTTEGHEAYMELKAEVEVAKEKALTN